MDWIWSRPSLVRGRRGDFWRIFNETLEKNAPVSFSTSVRLSRCLQEFENRWMELHKILYWGVSHSTDIVMGVSGSVVGWGTMPQAGRSRVRFAMRTLDLFNWPNPSSRTMTLGSTQPLTEMSTRNLPGDKGRAVCNVDNLAAICEPIV
jgi:hypothetical protein